MNYQQKILTRAKIASRLWYERYGDRKDLKSDEILQLWREAGGLIEKEAA
ncbi:hypothetical protein PCC6912_50650 [Chlorogloeopsis fritschii PCC 6912]|uniref:Uncharacterized protein n=1 Tax=Chlorogloeopsis fritschii PCC 6912 TaxID=211165 RepID=A0A3S0Y2B4_CHLFR|nr:hypothetical protein [Chlorogloeopsis fritschii]RUR74887.1 hypothetical protein PCC6912_50650 [Chlorogloeopsis fritschii PCC 6912]